MTEFRHLINRQAYGFIVTQTSMGEMSMVDPVTCLFSLFEALNDVFEVIFFSSSRASFFNLIKDTDSM